MNLADARRTWEDEQPVYEKLVLSAKEVMTRALRQDGLYYYVHGRTKSSTSLLKKVIRKNGAYEDIIDKAGIRVVVKFLSQLEQVDRLINNAFTVLHKDDKAEELGTTSIGYVSIHYKVCLDPRGPNDDDLKDRVFEIQLRTLCQHLWAEMAHDMSYKAAGSSAEIQRRINALSALLEVADREFEEAYGMSVSLPQSPDQLLSVLEPAFLPFASEPYDRELSLDIIDHLMPLVQTEPDIVGVLRDYGVRTGVSWEHIVKEYGPDMDEYLLASQPEGLLLGYLLERDRFGLMNHWQQRFPLQLLARLAVLWGHPLPDVN